MEHFRLLVAIFCLGVSVVRAADEDAGQTFQASGVTIYYETLGSAQGTPLVVAHGGPGFEHTYLHIADVWDTLAKTREVVLYDQRGVGRSSRIADGQSCTLKDQLEDLDALRTHLGAEQIDLLGHSWGGYLVMAYAARYPQHIRNLLIVDSMAPKAKDTVDLFKDVYPEGMEREDAVSFASRMGDKSAATQIIREYFSMLFYSPENRETAFAKLRALRERLGPREDHSEVQEAILKDLEGFDLSPELAKYSFPTIVMTGRFDMNVAPAVAYKIHKTIPGSQFVVFEHSGHMPFYEEPAQFLQTVESFLK